MEIEKYKRAVMNLARERSPIEFSNSQPEHAAIVINAMFVYSKNVLLFDENLSDDIAKYDSDIFLSLEKFGPTKSIKVMVKEVNESSQIFLKLKELSNKFPKNVSLKYSDEIFEKEIFNLFQKDIYFSIGDKESIRIEDVILPKLARKAFCSFYQPKTAKKLADVFENNFKRIEKKIC